MPKPSTPEQWLPILTARLDGNIPRVQQLSRYINGDAPVPEMGENVKESWIKFQKRARTNWGELIRDAVVDRIVPNGIVVNGKSDSPEAKQAQAIWRTNRMGTVFKDWLRYGTTFGEAYLSVWKGEDGKAIITADSPETMVVASNPLQPWRVRAGLRVWRDSDEERDYAMVWTESAWRRFYRSVYIDPNGTDANRRVHFTYSKGDWTADGEFDTPLQGGPPIVVYQNPDGVGEFEKHLDVIDRINAGVLQRLSISAMQAFKQRAIKGGLLPERDAEGNQIDWHQTFSAAPGALWNLPENLDIWESQSTDIRPLLDENRDDVRHLSAVTRTPFPVLIPDNANQSAEGAQTAKEGLIFKCGERVGIARIAAEGALLKALSVEGTELGDDKPLELLFNSVALVTLSEKYTAAVAAKSAGEPWKSIARNILGYSPEQIAQATLDKADELIEGMAVAAQMAKVTGAQQNPAGQPNTPAPQPNPAREAVNRNGNGREPVGAGRGRG